MYVTWNRKTSYIYQGNTFKMCFSDKAVNIATVGEFIPEYNTSIEYFYWHPRRRKNNCKAMPCY